MVESSEESMNYHTGVHVHPQCPDGAAWDDLLSRQAKPVPFMQHRYLRDLIESQSACPRTGWTAVWFTVHQGKDLVAAAVAWLKNHSYGEYVFDWAWAEAYTRHGLRYYPKLTLSIPFTPIPSSKLLATSLSTRLVLLRRIREWCEANELSSAHLLFLDEDDQYAIKADGWLLRNGVQFHWHNRTPDHYVDFPDFLNSLHREKRKKILQERRKVATAGVNFRVLRANEIQQKNWNFFHECYLRTYAEHQSSPYLNRDFFTLVGSDMPDNWLMFIASQSGSDIAASLVAIDPSQGIAWGRYWGATERVDCIHFEACYYQPLEWCIAHGFKSFEGGAQGEHKMARGLLPSATASAHWLSHPDFARAVGDFLQREDAGISDYLDELRERSPFKTPDEI
jgi:uncharacterized protein